MRPELGEEVRRQQFGALLRLSPQAIVILDVDGLVREWNPAAVELLGWTRDELVGRSLEVALGEYDRDRFLQVWSDLRSAQLASPLTSDSLHRDGTRVTVEVLLAPIQDVDGSFAGVVGTLSRHNATPQDDPFWSVPPSSAEAATSVERAASHWELDEVTGIAGRRWLQRRVLMGLPAGQDRAVAVLDVDAFALVNQVYGPETGDRVLRELALRLSERCAPAVVGRWQADEFVFVLDAENALARLTALLELAASAARLPFQLGDDEIRLTMSGGITSTARVPLTSLVRSASAAMAVAKATGRDRTLPFDDATMSTSAGPGLRMANDLQRGLLAGELRLHFQPIVDLKTNDVVGVEALVRWERPGVGLLTPAAFIEVAERTGQIVALGEWVTLAACRAAVAFADHGLPPLRVSINVSARQLSDPGLAPMLEAALAAADCDPRSIIIEVTETALLHDLDVAAGVLEGIRDLGVELDLDDFGTGYSSLLYLKHFPVDRIKIDQAFVAGIGVDVADTAIVASTIALAHSIGLMAIAEGVELPRQLALLRQMGCDYAQGYLLSHPLPWPELIEWLQRQVPSRLLERQPAARDSSEANGGERRDQRDDIADARDVAGDRRDALADAREGLADERERVRDLRSADAPAPSPKQAASHRAARRDRGQAAGDRAEAAVQRTRAKGARRIAAADRSADVVSPHRGDADAREEMSAEDRDSLTGAYLAAAGLAALRAEVEQARVAGEPAVLIHVTVVPEEAAQPAEQLAEDGTLVGVANALGAALRPQDLLVRLDEREFLCFIRGLSEVQVRERMATVPEAVVNGPTSGVDVAMRYARPRSDEVLEDLLARAKSEIRTF